jgi:hypothetical protein
MNICSYGRDLFGNPEEREHLPKKPLQSNGKEDMNFETTVCVTFKFNA